MPALSELSHRNAQCPPRCRERNEVCKIRRHWTNRLEALPGNRDLRKADGRGRGSADSGEGSRRRRRLHRYCGRLSDGCRFRFGRTNRGDRRQVAQGAAGSFHRCHQRRRPDGAVEVGPGHVAQTSARRHRRLASPVGYRLRRSLSASLRRSDGSDRRDFGSARIDFEFRESPLCRHFERPGISLGARVRTF